jgi:hypothetical protein
LNNPKQEKYIENLHIKVLKTLSQQDYDHINPDSSLAAIRDKDLLRIL